MMVADIGSDPSHQPATLVLRVVIFGIALLINLATASKADISRCGQASDLRAAHVRWAAARQNRIAPVDNEKSCRAYSVNFYEAVTVRYAISICRDGIDHQRDLDLLDSEIDTFNNLIASQCGND